ncbi:D-hexose-6-phosphate mutarotase [Cutibacterium sp. WCA-380-WT-3A]|uniref:D-hexose-6-phosphate mutarotase n=1 Tax=Cutibacterium porci TaxID=2605781 RepID=A0A7K0J8X3_9ACTN|nr:D-hexose-6-phosphate mutarotase [Cutibacterium porci]MSS46283.1 D-hexose-6-phosphate mutarotase [Cutibacterium porci]
MSTGIIHTARDGAWQVAEHGCQVLSWQPADTPVIWFDPEHADESEAVIRGGIPLCAPWFGHGPNNDQDPQHGLARRATFEVTVTEPFRVTGVAETASIGIRHDVVMTDAALEMTLTLTNHDHTPRTVEGMWHSYFRVADATQARVRGIQGTEWHNFATGERGSFDCDELAIAPDTDTVIQGVGTAIDLVDPVWDRRIHLETTRCPSAVVWNPRSSSAHSDNPTASAWRDFVCVETGMCKENAVSLLPGSSLTLSTQISVETL